MTINYLDDKNTYHGEIDEFISRRYQVVARLSVGGTAEIYQAFDSSKKIKVVIKILPSHYSVSNEKGQGNSKGKTLDISHRVIERSAEFMTQEANFLRSCRHPNIVRLCDHDLEAKRPYIVLNYLGNSNLEKEILNSAKNFSIEKTLGVLQQISSALGYIHKKGFVYCDVKPSNIIPSRRKFVLIDFGLVRPIGMAVSGGTIGYMPPEVLQDESGQVKASPIMDIYSLGVLLYELLTGFHPMAIRKIYDANHRYSFDNQLLANENASPSPASRLNPFLPDAFDEILLKCINKNPASRYQDVDSLLYDFEKKASQFI